MESFLCFVRAVMLLWMKFSCYLLCVVQKWLGEHWVPLSSPLYNFEIVIPSKDSKADIGCYGILCIPIHSGFLCRWWRLKAKAFLEIIRVVNLLGDLNGNEQNNLWEFYIKDNGFLWDKVHLYSCLFLNSFRILLHLGWMLFYTIPGWMIKIVP